MRLHRHTFLAAVLLLLAVTHSVAGQAAQPPRPAETVIVTGTYEPIPFEESDRSVTVLPVRKEQQILFQDLTGFLRLDPSVHLQARGPGNVQTDISIRGGTFGQTLVLWNGLRLNDAQTGHHNLDTPIPLALLDRVEILKGSGSTMYGSDAVGGVVNFVSRPPEASEVRLRTSVGSFGTTQQHVGLSLAGRAWTEEVAVARDSSSGFLPDRDYRNLSVASVTHHAGRIGATDIMLGVSDRSFGADQFYGNYPSWERTKSRFVGIRQSFGASTSLDVSYRRHTDVFVLYRDRPEVFTNRHALDTYQGALRRSLRLGENTSLHVGTDASYDAIRSSSLGAHTRGRAAAYGSLDFRALQRFSLNLGAREEVYRGWRHQFSPSMTGGVWLSPKLRLRAGSSHAFRLPSFTDLYYHDPANVGSPDLAPEQAWSHEVAAEWRPAERVFAQAALFQRRERDDIDYVRQTANDVWRATNIRRLRATGIETSVRTRLQKDSELTISYTALRLRTDSARGVLSKYASNYPIHNAAADYSAMIGQTLLLRTHISVLQRTGRATYLLWDLAASRGHGRVRPYVQLANLTDTSYQEVSGVPMPGRSIVGGIEIHATRRP